MPLEFLRDQARYNPYSDLVTFFAKDDDTTVMFNVTREALEYLETGSPLTERQLLDAFVRHLDRVLEVATILYAAGQTREGGLAFSLTKAHFAGQSENT